MNESVFENMTEELKRSITKDIAYTYSVFVPQNEDIPFATKVRVTSVRIPSLFGLIYKQVKDFFFFFRMLKTS